MGWPYLNPNNPYLSDILNNDDPYIYDFTACIHTTNTDPNEYWEA